MLTTQMQILRVVRVAVTDKLDAWIQKSLSWDQDYKSMSRYILPTQNVDFQKSLLLCLAALFFRGVADTADNVCPGKSE